MPLQSADGVTAVEKKARQEGKKTCNGEAEFHFEKLALLGGEEKLDMF